MQPDDSWQEMQDQDAQIVEFLDAVDTVAAFIGDDSVKRALLEAAHLPEPIPEQQRRIQFDGDSIPY